MEGIHMKWLICSSLAILGLGLGVQPSVAAPEEIAESPVTVLSATDSLTSDSVVADSAASNNIKGKKRNVYERHTHNYRKTWYKLIPNQTTLQYAGSIGVASFGVGWHYGKRHNWETDLLLGFVPKYNSQEVKVTFTVKERYVPWHLDISSRWMAEPLTTGIFLSSIFGEDFWNSEPSRYPNRYYGFSTRMRANIFLGQRMTYRIPSKKRHFFRSISAYYELSSCDMYIISKITNKNVKFKDILSLSAGLRMTIF